MTPDSAQRPALASAIYIRIPDFARKSVAEQAELKEQLQALVADAVATLVAKDRIVLDTDDGAALVMPGFPAIALDTARRLQRFAAGLPFTIGVNHGPVRVTENDGRMGGDALAAALTVAEFASPGGLLASRAFREALKANSPQRVRELCKAGDFTDANIRTHELFALDPGAALRRRQRWLILAGVGIAGFIALGVAGRMARLEIEAARRPAVIVLDVKPSGQLWVDGEDRGRTPPLSTLEVAAGPHQIEVRHPGLPPLKLEVKLGAGERITVSHTFVLPTKPDAKTAPRQRAKPEAERNFLERLKHRFGFK